MVWDYFLHMVYYQEGNYKRMLHTYDRYFQRDFWEVLKLRRRYRGRKLLIQFVKSVRDLQSIVEMTEVRQALIHKQSGIAWIYV